MCVWESLCGGIIGEIWALRGGTSPHTGCREPQNTETWILFLIRAANLRSLGVGVPRCPLSTTPTLSLYID